MEKTRVEVEGEEFLGTGEVARALCVHRTTVIGWLRAGLLRADYTTMGGHARFRPKTVQRLLRETGMSSTR